MSEDIKFKMIISVLIALFLGIFTCLYVLSHDVLVMIIIVLFVLALVLTWLSKPTDCKYDICDFIEFDPKPMFWRREEWNRHRYGKDD